MSQAVKISPYANPGMSVTIFLQEGRQTVKDLKERIAEEEEVPINSLKIIAFQQSASAWTTQNDDQKVAAEVKVHGVETFKTMSNMTIEKAIHVLRLLLDQCTGQKTVAVEKLYPSIVDHGFQGTPLGWKGFNAVIDTLKYDPKVSALSRCLERTLAGKQEKPRMATQEVLAMSEDLLEKYSDERIQASMEKIPISDHGNRDSNAMRELLLPSQLAVLPNYGFPNTPACVTEMLEEFKSHLNNAEVIRSLNRLNASVGRPVVDRAKNSGELEFSSNAAYSLAEEFTEEYKKKNFQDELRVLQEQFDPNFDDAKYIEKRKELLFKVQKEVLPRFGIEASQKGLVQMVSYFNKFHEDDALAVRLGAIDAALAPKFTQDRAVLLQKELIDVYSSPDFQEKLKCLTAFRIADQVTPEYNDKLADMILPLQKRIMPKYGFEPSRKGSSEMMNAFQPFFADWEVNKFGQEISELLGIPGPTEMGFVARNHPPANIHSKESSLFAGGYKA